MLDTLNKDGSCGTYPTVGWQTHRLCVCLVLSPASFGGVLIFASGCHPLQELARQTNSYDCGVWVLASITAVLRGFDVTGLQEADISAFRYFLLDLIVKMTG